MQPEAHAWAVFLLSDFSGLCWEVEMPRAVTNTTTLTRNCLRREVSHETT